MYPNSMGLWLFHCSPRIFLNDLVTRAGGSTRSSRVHRPLPLFFRAFFQPRIAAKLLFFERGFEVSFQAASTAVEVGSANLVSL